MEGHVVEADQSLLSFKSPAAPLPLSFKQSALQSVTLDNEKSAISYPDNVALANGDTIPCEIQSIGKESVILTLMGKEVELPMEKISSILFSTTRNIPLISIPQSLQKKILTDVPAVPAPFSKNKEKKDNTLPRGLNGETSITRDNWEVTGTTGWRWLGGEGKSSLEISATRGIMSKYFPLLTDRFSLSGTYLGATSSSRTAEQTFTQDVTSLPRGINFLFGGTITDHQCFFLQPLQNSEISDNFYSLALYPSEVVLFKVSHTLKKSIILLKKSVKRPNKNNSNYSFELMAKGNEFRLYINGELVDRVFDDEKGAVDPGVFSIFNGSIMPVILKDIKLNSSFKMTPSTIPLQRNSDSPCLVTNDEDIIPGELVNYDKEQKTITWLPSGGSQKTLTIPSSFVRALYVRKPVQKEELLKIRFDDFEQITGTIISLDEKFFRFQHPLLDELNIPREYINRLEYKPPASSDKTPE